jgi:hypothetical protein
MQAKREAAETARKIANYHKAQAAKAVSVANALTKAANARSPNFVRRGRFKVYNS